MLHLESKKTKSAFITGGIGDVIALEAFLTEEFRQTIETFFYATQKRTRIIELFSGLTNYPRLKFHINVWDDFSNFFCFYSIDEFVLFLETNQFVSQYCLKNCKDLSIFAVLQSIKAKEITYYGSSFLSECLADVSHLRLPKDFLVIAPYSSDKRISGRDYTLGDWRQTLNILNISGMYGVVIDGEPNNQTPENEMLINLSGKTTIRQSIEIIKAAKGFIGIDSWASVLAAKLFDNGLIQVKSVHQHLFDFIDLYYAPKTDFNFIERKIDCDKFLQLS